MATKKAAESTLYHLSPKGFWKNFRDAVVVNPEISSGLPLSSLNRYPTPASRPEKYSTPATKASDPAQNPYWKRDVRRAYPQLSVVTQSELSTLLLEHSGAKAVPAPSDAADKSGVPVADTKGVNLSEAIATITSQNQVYSESKLPPALPIPHKRWVPTLSPSAPHAPHSYFPMDLYRNCGSSNEIEHWRVCCRGKNVTCKAMSTSIPVLTLNAVPIKQRHTLMSAPPPPSPAAGSSAEVQAAAFADDPRIYFSKTSNTWRFEQDDGTELEYDPSKTAWLPLVDEDLISRQQAAYSVAGVDEETPAAPVLKRENKKRKAEEDYTSATGEANISIKRGKADKKEKPAAERKSKNTAVYVTGLPADAEQDEIIERFSKCGVIEEDENGEPKVKMYAKDDGSFSGEALVVYFKEDSVTLALTLLADSELRLGQPSTVMRVTKADFAHKTPGSAQGHEAKPRKTVDKKKITKRLGKMQRKLEEWGDDDGFGPQPDPADELNNFNKSGRVVVLKHMFTLDDLEKDASLLLDLKEDVRDECSSLGEVTNVVLYDQEEDGVMTVKFKDPIAAQACLIKMNGRFFDGRRVSAELFTGKQRFKRSGTGEDVGGDSEDAERKRLDDFAQWLLMEED